MAEKEPIIDRTFVRSLQSPSVRGAYLRGAMGLPPPPYQPTTPTTGEVVASSAEEASDIPSQYRDAPIDGDVLGE